MSATLTIGFDDVRRASCQTACDDHDVRLDPGTYPLRFLSVDFRPVDPESPRAYWACASIPCTRLHNGARYGKAGDRGTFYFQGYAQEHAGPLANQHGRARLSALGLFLCGFAAFVLVHLSLAWGWIVETHLWEGVAK